MTNKIFKIIFLSLFAITTWTIPVLYFKKEFLPSFIFNHRIEGIPEILILLIILWLSAMGLLLCNWVISNKRIRELKEDFIKISNGLGDSVVLHKYKDEEIAKQKSLYATLSSDYAKLNTIKEANVITNIANISDISNRLQILTAEKSKLFNENLELKKEIIALGEKLAAKKPVKKSKKIVIRENHGLLNPKNMAHLEFKKLKK